MPVKFSYMYICLQVSASHTTVLLLLSEATSVAMEMSDVVFTVCAAEPSLQSADTYQITMLLPLELPHNAGGLQLEENVCLCLYAHTQGFWS